jgi:hypothetical protein
MSSSPLYFRVYVRAAVSDAYSASRWCEAWPGAEWMQINARQARAIGNHLFVVIDTDASCEDADLRVHLPPGVTKLHFRGRGAVSDRWVNDLASLAQLRDLALDTVPAPKPLEALTQCCAIESLTLGRSGMRALHDPATLAVAARMQRLVRLELHNFDLSHRTLGKALEGITQLTAAIDPENQPSGGAWHGLQWLVGLRGLTQLSLTVPGLEPNCLDVIGQLCSLRGLTLQWCRLRESTLRALSGLDALERLDLAEADLGKGTLKAIAGARALRELRVGSILDEAALRSFGTLPRLESLVLVNGALDAPLHALENAAALRMLDLASADLHPATLAGLDKLSSLETLDLSETAADDCSIQALAALPRLHYLNVAGCTNVSLSGGFTAKAFEHLRVIDISATAADDAALRVLSQLPRLEILRASDLATTVTQFAFADRLVELKLDRSARTGEGLIAALSQCRHLQALSLGDILVDTYTVAALSHLHTLRYLRMMLAGPDVLRAFNCAGLTELVVDATDLSAGTIEEIARCPSLRTLVLDRCTLPDDTALAPLAGTLIESLSLVRSRISAVSAIASLVGLRLRCLNLTDSDAEDRQLSGAASQTLEKLVIYQTKVTVGGLMATGNLPALHAVCGVPAPLSTRELEELRAKFPACWSLPLGGTSGTCQ